MAKSVASPRARRPRGSLDPRTTSPLYARIDDRAKAKFDEIADNAGVSLGVVLEVLAEHLDLDESGLPTWWPTANGQQEELPLKTA